MLTGVPGIRTILFDTASRAIVQQAVLSPSLQLMSDRWATNYRL